MARAGASKPRLRGALLPRRPKPFDLALTGHHDFGDGRVAIEFERPALDLMLYHDDGVTLAEWITTNGELLALVTVGRC